MTRGNVHLPPHEAAFWRRLASWGAVHGPTWWVRYSPPVFGAAAAILVKDARRAALRNLHRIRGPASPAKDARDVLATFSSYASCLAEMLANASPDGPVTPSATIYGERHIKTALARGKGIVLVTAHTAGWEVAGPLLARDYAAKIMLVMQPEPDERARAISDEARRRAGLAIAHVGTDALASLPLLRHLNEGGIVALQLDRYAPGMRTRSSQGWKLPEGPIRLAQLSGAPLLPVFCAREGFRKYVIDAYAPLLVPRRASEAELDDAAAHLASAMTRFLRAHPTQWFHWA
jgi:KDO2-lipid IV(A) lauroyltransferase